MSRPQQAQNIVERVSSLDPGIYTADSNTDGYGSLMAALDMGAEFLGDNYLKNGVRSIAIEVGGNSVRHNPGVHRAYIKIGESFYTKALLDYRPDWRPMWVREVVQNSVDAGRRHLPNGLTIIDIETKQQPDGSYIVSCTDNGGGMTWDIFENKFLALGESGKTVEGRYDYRSEIEKTRASTEETEEGDAGGFGEAKRLIMLPWPEVEIQSQDWAVKACPSTGKPFEPVKSSGYLSGVKISVRMPANNHVGEEHALRVITRSLLPNVRFTVNGKSYKADLELGDEIRTFAESCSGKALLYHSPKTRRIDKADRASSADSIDGYKPKKVNELIVRKRGIWMFSKSVDSNVPGYLVLRLVAPSVDVLTASRMQIGDGELEEAVDEYLRGLAKDTRKALKTGKNKIWKAYRGSLGMVRAEVREENEKLAAIMRQKVGAADKIAERESVGVIQEFMEQTAKTSDAAEQKSEEEGQDKSKPFDEVEGPKVGDEDEREEKEEDDDEKGGQEQEGPPRLTHDPDLAKLYAEAAAKAGPRGAEALVKVIQGVPDVAILSEIEDYYRDKETGKILTGDQYRRKHGMDEDAALPQRRLWRPAKKFDPNHLTPKLRKLLKYWTEVLSVILIALGEHRPFGVGWVFDFRKRGWGRDAIVEGALAVHAVRDGKDWLMLNPFRGGDIQAEELYSLRVEEDLKLIHSCAMHEATHFHNDVGDHDVDFAIALTKNIAIANLSVAELKAIRDAAVKRLPDWKPRPKVERVSRPKKIKFNEKTEEQIQKALVKFKREAKKSSYVYETFQIFAANGRIIGAVALSSDYGSNYNNIGKYEAEIKFTEGSHYDTKTLVKMGFPTSDEAQKYVINNFRSIVAEHIPGAVMPTESKAPAESKNRSSIQIAVDLRDALVDDIMRSGSDAMAEVDDWRVDTTFDMNDDDNGGVWKVRLIRNSTGMTVESTRLHSPDDVPNHWPTGNAERHLVMRVADRIVNWMEPIIEDNQ